ncbi:MAG: alpha/beta hydrolase [Pseudomonadota bacterium]|uniref:alpha/beta fold hydrolase n=1 Tax=Sphingomonas sp. ERG5 TaxID=1381597 RepID=UPI00068E75AA|nr:alpha/beta hydrolase [Sphingomonas sp. ERG5]
MTKPLAAPNLRPRDRRSFLKLTTGAIGTMVLSGLASHSWAHSGPVSADSLHVKEYNRIRRFVALPAGRVAYVEAGAGPVALFLHGFPLNSFQWRHAIERLSMHRRCVAPDFLALGYTEVARGQDVGPMAQMAMIVSLLDKLGIKDVDLIANDSGGAIAQLLMVHYPDRVRTLLLTNCDSEIDCPPPALTPVIELSKKGRYADGWLVPWQADPVLARSSTGFGGMCFSDPTQPTDEAIATYFTPLIATPQRKRLIEAYAIALEQNALAGISTDLRRSTVPTRILWGTGDTIFSPESPAYLDRTLGVSRGIRRLEGKKLFWPEEASEIVAEEARVLWNIASEV